jgi:PhzF family phenazine biosynthesis protein
MSQEIPLYQVDAFTDAVFAGNPAAVCPLEAWLPDDLLQAIASENNLSETAYFVAEGDGYRLRWFTPAAEVDLCGHATLATAHVIATILDPEVSELRFQTRSGLLTVARSGDGYAMDFPAIVGEPSPQATAVAEALGAQPIAVFQAMDVMAVLETESEVLALKPDFARLAKIDTRGVIATAPGGAVDFVSRFFAPLHDIPEDPVTGSAHSMLTPYWAERLGKTKMTARQVSARGGELTVEDRGERVVIGGKAALFMVGQITV